MLPIHIFDGSKHYVLVKAGGRFAADSDARVDRVQARALLEGALRRRSSNLLRDLAVLLDLRGYDLDDEFVVSRSLEAISSASGRLMLLRTRQFEVRPGRIEIDRPSEPDDEPVDNEIETHWIEIELKTDAGDPVPRALYEIELPNGQKVTGRLNDAGQARYDGITPGECKVRFPEYDDTDPEGEAEPDEAEPPPPEECELDYVKLECSHANKRGHKLRLPPTRAKEGEETQILEVIGAAEGSGDTIKLENVLMHSRCAEHAGKGFLVQRPRPAQTLELATDAAEFEAYYGPASYREWLWPWDARPVEYTARPVTCDAGRRHAAIVRVYPDYQVTFKLAVGLDAAARSGDKLAKAREAGMVERRGRPAHTDWSFSIDGSMAYGSESFNLSLSYKSKLKNIQAINRWVKKAIDLFCQIFRKFFGLDLELELPSLALDYKGKFVELEQSYKVDREWSLTFNADPIFGVVLKIDVLELALKALQKIPVLAPVATFLLEVKTLAAKHDNKLELVAKFNGRVGFEASASKKAGDPKKTAHAKGRGQVIVGFEANVAVSGTKWLVSFEAGASLAGATGVSLEPGLLSDDKGVALTCDLILMPLTFEWGAYASGKFIWEAKGSVKGSKNFWEEKKLMDGKYYVVKADGAAA